MQRMGGGGNDPSCGCDMQAGWPSASTFPRGGLQGGRRINSFSLELTGNNGKIEVFKGKRENRQTMRKTTKTNKKTNRNTNRNTNTLAVNENTQESMETVSTAPSSMKTTTNTGMKKIVHKGKVYFLNRNTMEVYEQGNADNAGKKVGKLVRGRNGTTIKTNTQNSVASPPEMESEETENMSNYNLEPEENQEGGKRRSRKTRRKSRKHLKRK